MEQWKILVLGTLRLGLNADYDRIHELANQHHTIRQMLGHGFMDDMKEYNLQSLKDNLCLFTPEILDRINQEVVKAGHLLLKKTPPTSAAAVTLLLSKPMSTFLPISICSTTLYAKPSKNARFNVIGMILQTGGKVATISKRSKHNIA
ncbi:MAG: hypothetical protein HXX11_12600 [Desulfuromonadales bacterium]|nr:hypothetical protein [Desulfuromonadales bacterium]